jgi:multiple sugar transport system permease protein
MALPRTKLARREALEGYIFLLPWVIGFLAFHFGPLLASLYLGFTNYRGAGSPTWIGLENFKRMFTEDPLFWQSLKVTVLYAVGFLPVGLVVGFGIALLMNQKVWGISVFRTIYYLPSVMTGVAVAILWQFVFHREYGVLNSILRLFGAEPIAWLNNSQWVLVAFIIMGLWGVGGGMIVYLSGLQSIPTELYEAASIDGANRWRRFWAITIPMMTPTIFFNLVTGLIATFQIFTTAYIMTQGGPNYGTYFFSLNIYYTTFRSLRLGYASALAWMLFVLILVLTLLVFSTARRWVFYAGEKAETR